MNATDFCYWLQGFFELTGSKKLTPTQVKMIKEHLALTMTKVTPPLTIPLTTDKLVIPTTPWTPVVSPNDWPAGDWTIPNLPEDLGKIIVTCSEQPTRYC